MCSKTLRVTCGLLRIPSSTSSTPGPNALPATVTTPTTPRVSAAIRSKASPVIVAAIYGSPLRTPAWTGSTRRPRHSRTTAMTATAGSSGGSGVSSRISRGDIWFVADRGLFHLNPQTGQITRPPGMIRASPPSTCTKTSRRFLDAGLFPERRAGQVSAARRARHRVSARRRGDDAGQQHASR